MRGTNGNDPVAALFAEDRSKQSLLAHKGIRAKNVPSIVFLRLIEAIELSEMELKALAGRQLILEEEIQVKSNSIYIDDVVCRQLHEPVTIHNF